MHLLRWGLGVLCHHLIINVRKIETVKIQLSRCKDSFGMPLRGRMLNQSQLLEKYIFPRYAPR